MTQLMERRSFEPIANLLRMAAPNKAADLDKLLQRLTPTLEIDRSESRILFQADSKHNIIRVGMKCTCRLQAHGLAAGVVIAAIGTPGFKTMGKDDLHNLLAPADKLLNWAVSHDLQASLKQIEGFERDVDSVLSGATADLTDGLLSSLNRTQRTLGEGIFRYAAAYLLLHELGHLQYGHVRCDGFWSIQQEKDVDRFAADWLLESASASADDAEAERLNVLFGIAVALLWLTVFNVFLGQHESNTHPESYERLFQVLDHAIDLDDWDEYRMVWYFAGQMLILHMHAAGFDCEPHQFQWDDPRKDVNTLIDMISRR